MFFTLMMQLDRDVFAVRRAIDGSTRKITRAVTITTNVTSIAVIPDNDLARKSRFIDVLVEIVRRRSLQLPVIQPFDISGLDHVNAVGRLQAAFNQEKTFLSDGQAQFLE